MSWQAASWLLLGGSTVLLFLGLPVAYSFLIINVFGAALILGGEAGMAQMLRNCVGSVASFSLTPIPLFILMGEVLFRTGLAVKVLDAIERLIRNVPGRLAVVTVVAGALFSAISHSTIATTAMLGSLMVPVMLKRGYHPTLATGPVMAIGAVDMLFPLSALTILLGSLSGISIAKLLFAGLLPGVLLTLVFVLYIVVRVTLRPALAPASSFAEYTGWEQMRPFVVYALPLLSILFVVVGAMLTGVATPTESAAIGAFATILFAMAYRALTWQRLLDSLRGTIVVSGMVLFIIIGATTFAQILAFSGVSHGIVQLITGHDISGTTIVVGMMAVLVFLGIFVDQVSMMLITLPVYMPIVQQLGINQIWFGVLFLMCMQLGLLMPPHGLLLMTMRGVTPREVTMMHLFQAVIPYLIFSVLALLLVFLWPPLATWIPGLM